VEVEMEVEAEVEEKPITPVTPKCRKLIFFFLGMSIFQKM